MSLVTLIKAIPKSAPAVSSGFIVYLINTPSPEVIRIYATITLNKKTVRVFIMAPGSMLDKDETFFITKKAIQTKAPSTSSFTPASDVMS